jgi:putative DNA primase/helicase
MKPEADAFPFQIVEEDSLVVEEEVPKMRGYGGSHLVKLPGTPAADLASEYLSARNLRALFWRGEIYRYTGRGYEPIPDGDLRADVLRFLQEGEYRRRAGVRLTNDVIANLQAMTLIPSSVEPPVLLAEGEAVPAPLDLLPFRNGLVDFSALQRGEDPLHPHGPEWFTLSPLPFDFDPDAEEPKEWHRFLDELFDDDIESRDALQEMFGYILSGETRQQKIFLIVGPKRSGKGTIARIISALVGKENTVWPTLASLGGSFGLAPLIGKKVAVIADARIGRKADQTAVAEELLAISGEDSRTVHRKYLPAITARLPIRFLILTNEIPRITDQSGALASRIVLLTLENTFLGREDHFLFDRLLVELPLIGMWTVRGLERFRERGHFIQPSSSIDAVRTLEDLGSPIAAFIRDRCILEPGSAVEVQHLFDEYRDWCKTVGRDHAGTIHTFGRDLHSFEPRIKVIQHRIGDDRVRMYSGIRKR